MTTIWVKGRHYVGSKRSGAAALLVAPTLWAVDMPGQRCSYYYNDEEASLPLC